jgi:hypothetical protein
MDIIRVDVTTDAAGAGRGQANQRTKGVLYALQLVDGGFCGCVDVVVTFEQDSVSIPVLTKADFNTDQIVYPRDYAAKVADGISLIDVVLPISVGYPKVVVAAGGNVKSGSFIFYIIPM